MTRVAAKSGMKIPGTTLGRPIRRHRKALTAVAVALALVVSAAGHVAQRTEKPILPGRTHGAANTSP